MGDTQAEVGNVAASCSDHDVNSIRNAGGWMDAIYLFLYLCAGWPSWMISSYSLPRRTSWSERMGRARIQLTQIPPDGAAVILQDPPYGAYAMQKGFIYE